MGVVPVWGLQIRADSRACGKDTSGLGQALAGGRGRAGG